MKRFDLDALRYDEQGLIPAVVQEAATSQVLMVAYMNRESLEKTLQTGYAWYYSRSRGRLWKKGEESGHVQKVVEMWTDCDQDALLLRVEQAGAGACHEAGYRSCFHNGVEGAPLPEGVREAGEPDVSASGIFETLYQVIEERRRSPQEGSYTSYLFREGINKMLKKVGEESAEVIIAAKDPDDEPLIAEAADLLYHLLVVLAQRRIRPEAVLSELTKRRGGASPS